MQHTDDQRRAVRDLVLGKPMFQTACKKNQRTINYLHICAGYGSLALTLLSFTLTQLLTTNLQFQEITSSSDDT